MRFKKGQEVVALITARENKTNLLVLEEGKIYTIEDHLGCGCEFYDIGVRVNPNEFTLSDICPECNKPIPVRPKIFVKGIYLAPLDDISLELEEILSEETELEFKNHIKLERLDLKELIDILEEKPIDQLKEYAKQTRIHEIFN